MYDALMALETISIESGAWLDVGNGVRARKWFECRVRMDDPNLVVTVMAEMQGDRYCPVRVTVDGTATNETLRRVPVAEIMSLGDAVRHSGAISDGLEGVSTIYRMALLAGRPPTAAIAREFGITRRAATDRIRRARLAGFLPPTTPGKSAGA